MLLQDTFGEFDSTQRLKNLIQLICQLTGTYEVLLKAESGEEGILHCSNGTIRNAAYRNLSGMEALSIIIKWSKGKYWLEELPVLPVRTIHEPLEKVLSDAERIAASKANEIIVPATDLETSEGKLGQKDSSAKVTEKPISDERKEPATVIKTEKEEQKFVPLTKPEESRPLPASAESVASKDKFVKDDTILKELTSISGIKGIIMASMDGTLLKMHGTESGAGAAQLLALLGEALEQTGEVFEKGKLIHGSIEFADKKILLHSFQNNYIGSEIDLETSSQIVGSEIEKLLEKGKQL